MAVDVTPDAVGVLVDPFGGRDDLGAGQAGAHRMRYAVIEKTGEKLQDQLLRFINDGKLLLSQSMETLAESYVELMAPAEKADEAPPVTPMAKAEIQEAKEHDLPEAAIVPPPVEAEKVVAEMYSARASYESSSSL